ncbi:tetratricopeptide repeat protein [Chryseotalea sanaruensis]|uniref:histidine kinase n=1 Tax=Chryseotalea sanaruensis TaxID=2482724 RepID=A0A401UAJ7_9BACT|nr:tetratricopeptide repeat protein [Chryseotalea sanaruensis]GCC51907.1 tetratricopeptide repeat protein [Chryseotalea sanaruensis]
MRALPALLCLFCYSLLSAQPQDSLELLLPGTSGVERAKLYYQLISFYQRSNLEKVSRYAKEAESYAKENPEPLIKAYANICLGSYYSSTGKIDSAILLFEKGYAEAEVAKDTVVLIKIVGSLGRTLISAGRAKDALEYLYTSLRWLERYPDDATNFRIRTNITWANLELKRYKEAISFGRKSLTLMENEQWEWIAAYTYNNLAICYGVTGNLDSARYFVDKSLIVTEKSGDNSLKANAYFILGKIYSESGKLELALEQYQFARALREKIGNPFFIVSDLYVIADLYYQLGDYKKGIEAGTEALTLAEKHDLLLKFDGTYLTLAKNFEGLKDFKNASKYYYLWAITKDSLYQQSQAEAIAEMSTKYETEKKEQQLVLQQSQLDQQQSQLTKTYVVVVALVIIIALIIVILYLVSNRHKKQQQLADKKRQLEVREAYINATIQSQESERKRVAQDLHDGMGQLISALSMYMSKLSPNTPQEERVTVVEEAETILKDMHREVRAVAFNLMPQTLIQHGLVAALQEMAYRLNESGKIKVEITSFQIPERMTEVKEISLYRILQEWVTNIIKYAKATKVAINLVDNEDEISVTVEDNGEGFNVAELDKGSGNGWKNIQSRLNLLKGNIEIDSKIGRNGTTLVLGIPKEHELVVSETIK